ncbi:CSC1-like protein At4g02900 isoform X2 [Capsicum annuum]|uniref:CSC1-like protein At4g02900 isoform X2 n=1 Tax=Capsicum annuum TaxID=4072 RepID=UPI001FB0EA1A|nr:CSC1-like protein At4g02900 isoform X2 [Capsicum annuum]
MASSEDILLSAVLNLLSAFAFLVAFAILRLQPINDRVYFSKWYLKGIRASPRSSGAFMKKFVNLDCRTYIRFLNWMPAALRMPEPELIDHAGLDSAVYIRIYLLGLKIFVPITLLSFGVLVPVNWTGKSLEHIEDLTFSTIDKLSISNVPSGSPRFWAHLVMAYVVTFWTCYILYKEYHIITTMRLQFLASENRRPDQFTVLVRNVPPDPDESVSEHVEHFFCVNHPDHYLTQQVVYNANNLAKLVEKKKSYRNWLTYYQTKYERNPKIKPKTKTGFWGLWGKTVDAIEYYTEEIEKLNKDSLASIDGIENKLPVLRPLIQIEVVKSFIQGVLPGIILKIFLALLPMLLMAMSKIEGYTSLSSLDRRSATKYHIFILVNVFLGSIITGAAFEQLQRFMEKPPSEIPKTVGVAIPLKATFFITYIMVDGWAGIAAEILRLVPFVIFHLKNTFLVKTDQDRQQATDPGSLNFSVSEPRIQLYFLLGLVYSMVTPILLPFIIVFFAFAYMVFRHQIINVYNQKYESGASFWPDVHRRILVGLVISQLLLLGLLSNKNVARSTPVLIALPILTIWFHIFCKGRYESAFMKFPLQDAMVKDTLERATEPTLNLKAYLKDAYVHPVFKGVELDRPTAIDDEENNPLVATKRSRRSSKPHSEEGAETRAVELVVTRSR